MHGPLAVAHNGNIVNAVGLRDELLDRGFGLSLRFGDDDALARIEAIGFDDDGDREAFEYGQCFFGAGAADISGGRDARTRAQILGEAL